MKIGSLILNFNLIFPPQNSHSQLSIFPRELSFSFLTLQNFREKSHSRSRLSVYLLLQKSLTSKPKLSFVASSTKDQAMVTMAASLQKARPETPNPGGSIRSLNFEQKVNFGLPTSLRREPVYSHQGNFGWVLWQTATGATPR